MCAAINAVKEESAHATFTHLYTYSCPFLATAGAAYELQSTSARVTEGLTMSVTPRLRVMTVPSGGVQGLIELPLMFSSSGASESISH